MNVLVAGGAGYIGSVCVEVLLAAGHRVAVVDNLSRGHRSAVPPEASFHCGDVSDREFLRRVFSEFEPEAVVHLCALSLVAESVERPLDYYCNNLAGGLALLDVMQEFHVRRFVFSSSAAIFGEPSSVPIAEPAPKNPLNPYGRTKWMFEQILSDVAKATDLCAVSLRYFNAAGATESRGEDHRPETHLIPLVLEVAEGRRSHITVFGDDYPTPDGSCVRDYIHVLDLARAHALALENMDRLAGVVAYNLGNGNGFSVLEILDAARRVTGRPIPFRVGPRRPGDPAVLVACSEKIRRELGWHPHVQDIESMIESAWRWKLAHPHGYPD